MRLNKAVRRENIEQTSVEVTLWVPCESSQQTDSSHHWMVLLMGGDSTAWLIHWRMRMEEREKCMRFCCCYLCFFPRNICPNKIAVSVWMGKDVLAVNAFLLIPDRLFKRDQWRSRSKFGTRDGRDWKAGRRVLMRLTCLQEEVTLREKGKSAGKSYWC